MKRAARGWKGFAGWVLLAGLATAARADDVTTLSGVTYRELRLVRVEPDGVTWEHANGVVKVDFTDLPEPVRKAYHYDAGKAAAFLAVQAQARQQAAALAQQDQRKVEARRAQQFQQQAAAAPTGGTDGSPGFVFRYQDHAAVAATQIVGAQVEAQKVALAKLTEHDGTIWDRRLWAVPAMILGHSDGHTYDRPDMDSPEYKRRLLSSPDNQAWYDGVDRAAAFARGRP